MGTTTKEEALARRRAQNREAQRKFREKQSQLKEKASAAEREQEQNRANADANPSASFLSSYLAPSADLLSENLALPTPEDEDGPSGCFITSGLRLLGNYTLLDSFDMEGCAKVPQATNEEGFWGMGTPSPTVDGQHTADVATAPSQNSESPHWTTFPPDEARNATIPGRGRANSRGIQQQTPRSSGAIPHLQTPASSIMEVDHLGDAIPDENSKSRGWMSPLHIAARNGHDRIVRMLLEHKGDSNELDSDGLTPLFYATIGGHEHVVTLLLGHGALVSSTDSEGRTVLHLAVIHRRESVLKALLNHCVGNQALIDCYNNAGRTPLHVAVDIDFEAGVSVLLEHGANLNFKARKAP